MKRLLWIVLLSSIAHAQWFPFPGPGTKKYGGGGMNTFTLVQTVNQANCNACAITVSAIGSGHLLVIQASDQAGGGANFITGANCSSTCGTWVVPTGTANQLNNACCGAVSYAYILSSTSGATTITPTVSNARNYFFAIYEYSYTPGPISVDTSNTNLNASCGSCAGITLSLTGTNDVIDQMIVSGTATPSAVTTYGNFAHSSFTGFADLENTSSGTAPTWTVTAGQVVVGAVAFK